MDSQFIYTGPENNIINNSTTVCLQDIVIFQRDGEIIGKLDAQIDFKDLAPELHGHAVQLLSGMPISLQLASERIPTNSPEFEPEPELKPLESIWQKIKNYLES